MPGRNTDDSDADLYAEYHEHIVMETPSSEVKMLLHPPDNLPPGPRQQYHSSSESEDFTFSDIAPDLSSSISTNFSELDSALGTPAKGEEPKQETEGGFDFASRFEPFYKEHRDTAADRAVYYEQRRRDRTETATAAHRFTSEGYEDDVFHMEGSRTSGTSLCFCEVFVVERNHSSGTSVCFCEVFVVERSHSSGTSLSFCEVFVVERSHSSGTSVCFCDVFDIERNHSSGINIMCFCEVFDIESNRSSGTNMWFY